MPNGFLFSLSLFFFFFANNSKISVKMMACLQAYVFIPLYVASGFEVLSNDRVAVCPT